MLLREHPALQLQRGWQRPAVVRRRVNAARLMRGFLAIAQRRIRRPPKARKLRASVSVPLEKQFEDRACRRQCGRRPLPEAPASGSVVAPLWRELVEARLVRRCSTDDPRRLMVLRRGRGSAQAADVDISMTPENQRPCRRRGLEWIEVDRRADRARRWPALSWRRHVTLSRDREQAPGTFGMGQSLDRHHQLGKKGELGKSPTSAGKRRSALRGCSRRDQFDAPGRRA